MIAVFGYAFPHRKTQEFLFELKLMGLNEVIVFGAPWKELNIPKSSNLITKKITKTKPYSTKEICKSLGYNFYELDHDNYNEIKNIVQIKKIHIGIISGARILKSDIIQLFREGIVNFHPGKIPETSGLDAFYYSIKNNIGIGVTTHFIDSRVDAGKIIEFNALNVNSKDSIEDILERNFYIQIDALRNFIKLFLTKSIKTTPIQSYSKNLPMNGNAKKKILTKYNTWKNNQIIQQHYEQLLTLCALGNMKNISNILEKRPFFLEYKNQKGWTPLIVACFNHREKVVDYLLSIGANPNVQNINGTTPLMYAKTKLMNQKKLNTTILDKLIQSGASPYIKDKTGKSVLDYCKTDINLKNYFHGKL